MASKAKKWTTVFGYIDPEAVNDYGGMTVRWKRAPDVGCTQRITMTIPITRKSPPAGKARGGSSGSQRQDSRGCPNLWVQVQRRLLSGVLPWQGEVL